MGIITTILVVGAIWYLFKIFSEGTPSSRIEKYEEFAESMFRSYRVTNKVAYGIEDDEPEVLRMKDWYIRLKEKYKHDTNRLLQLAEDWSDYVYNLSRKGSQHYLWLESEDKEEGESHYQEARESYLKIEEIENRFAEMLGPKEREKLEAQRKKEQKEFEATWPSLVSK